MRGECGRGWEKGGGESVGGDRPCRVVGETIFTAKCDDIPAFLTLEHYRALRYLNSFRQLNVVRRMYDCTQVL